VPRQVPSRRKLTPHRRSIHWSTHRRITPLKKMRGASPRISILIPRRRPRAPPCYGRTSTKPTRPAVYLGNAITPEVRAPPKRPGAGLNLLVTLRQRFTSFDTERPASCIGSCCIAMMTAFVQGFG
jgi:hypothetical protein